MFKHHKNRSDSDIKTIFETARYDVFSNINNANTLFIFGCLLIILGLGLVVYGVNFVFIGQSLAAFSNPVVLAINTFMFYYAFIMLKTILMLTLMSKKLGAEL